MIKGKMSDHCVVCKFGGGEKAIISDCATSKACTTGGFLYYIRMMKEVSGARNAGEKSVLKICSTGRNNILFLISICYVKNVGINEIITLLKIRYLSIILYIIPKSTCFCSHNKWLYNNFSTN